MMRDPYSNEQLRFERSTQEFCPLLSGDDRDGNVPLVVIWMIFFLVMIV